MSAKGDTVTRTWQFIFHVHAGKLHLILYIYAQ